MLSAVAVVACGITIVGGGGGASDADEVIGFEIGMNDEEVEKYC